MLKISPICLSGVTQKSVAARTDNYVDVFVRENVAQSNFGEELYI